MPARCAKSTAPMTKRRELARSTSNPISNRANAPPRLSG